MKLKSIRSKLLIFSFGGITFFSLIIAWMVHWDYRKNLINELKRRGNITSRWLSTAVQKAALTENEALVKQIVTQYQSLDKDIVYIYISNPYGGIVYHTFEGGFPGDLMELSSTCGEPVSLETEYGPVEDVSSGIIDNKAGCVHLGLSASLIKKQVKNNLRNLLLVLAFVWSTGIVVLSCLATSVTRPISEVISAIKKLGEGDKNIQIGVISDDETGHLAKAFNSMSEKLTAHEIELEETRDYLLGIVENSSDLIITSDPSDSIVMFNRGAERILEYRREDMIGSNWRELFFDTDDLKNFLEELDTEDKISGFETRFKKESGEIVYVLLTKSSLKTPDGSIVGKILIGVDITDYKDFQQKLINAERHAAIGQAMTRIMHGAKNILNAFKGGQYMVNTAMKKDDRDLLKNGWEVVENGINRMSELTRDLLDFSRAGKLEMKKASLNSIAREVIWSIRHSLDEKDIRIFSELDESIPEMFFDPKVLHTTLMNLVSNAVDACTMNEYPGGSRGEIVIGSYFDDENREVCIEIKDNGCGIPGEILNDIFTPFYSTKHSKGNGLGLPISRKVARQHGGDIEVASEAGKGTVFTLKLPLKKPVGERGEHNLSVSKQRT